MVPLPFMVQVCDAGLVPQSHICTLIAALMAVPLKVSARCCQVPVPGAVTVPLANVVWLPLWLLRMTDQAPVFASCR